MTTQYRGVKLQEGATAIATPTRQGHLVEDWSQFISERPQAGQMGRSSHLNECIRALRPRVGAVEGSTALHSGAGAGQESIPERISYKLRIFGRCQGHSHRF